MVAKVVGVDSCPYGWCIATLSLQTGSVAAVSLERVCKFQEVVSKSEQAKAIAVDIPIGLPNAKTYPRTCDREARKRLGPKRGPSVFYVPPRQVVRECAHIPYRQACKRAQQIFGRKLSQQTYRILQKIDEVDRCMTPTRQAHFIEVHPEFCFLAINRRRSLRHNKKRERGYQERLSLLTHHLPQHAIESVLDRFPRKEVGRDDVLDALVAACTALRYARGKYQCLPAEPPTDSRGLRMEMIFPT